MRKLRGSVAASLAVYLGGVGVSVGQSPNVLSPSQSNDATAANQSTGLDSSWVWYVTPRAWFTTLSDKRFQPGASDVEQTQSFPIYMGGATIGVKPPGWDTTVDFTALYGGSSGASFTQADLLAGDAFQGTIRASRLDVESLAHIPFGSKVATIDVGMRYIHSSSNITGSDLFGLPFQFREKSNYFIPEIGLSAASPPLWADSDYKQYIFGAMSVGIGYKQTTDNDTCCSGLNTVFYTRSGGVVALDGFVGYQIQLGKAWNAIRASVRYRFQYISQGRFDLSQPTFISGPEISFTIPFH